MQDKWKGRRDQKMGQVLECQDRNIRCYVDTGQGHREFLKNDQNLSAEGKI